MMISRVFVYVLHVVQMCQATIPNDCNELEMDVLQQLDTLGRSEMQHITYFITTAGHLKKVIHVCDFFKEFSLGTCCV